LFAAITIALNKFTHHLAFSLKRLSCGGYNFGGFDIQCLEVEANAGVAIRTRY
jgi:hypothetical protein